MKLIAIIIMNIIFSHSLAKETLPLKKSTHKSLHKQKGTIIKRHIVENPLIQKNSSELIREYYLKRYDIPDVKTKRLVKIALIDSGFEREEIIPQVRSLSSEYPTTYPHGTHVGGVIIGVNPNIELYSYNVYINNNKSVTDNVANAIEDAIKNKVEIINLSMDGDSADSAEFNAIKDALKAGIVVVIAAGNKQKELKYDSTCSIFPACYKRKLKDLIIVGNINNHKMLHQSSNFGEIVDVFYYGSMIPSYDSRHGINTMSGTSISAPFITGLVSLLIGNDYQKYSPHEVLEYIKNHSVRYNENPKVSISFLKMKLPEIILVSGNR